MIKYPNAISPEVRRELEADDEGLALLRTLDAKERRWYEDRYPEPSVPEILEIWEDHRTEYRVWQQGIQDIRTVRYGKDDNPEEFKDRLKSDRRVRTRLSNNEILRVVGMATRNAPVAMVEPLGSGQKLQSRAELQTRFCNQFLRTMARRSGKNVLRQLADNMFGDSLGCLLVYLTDAYDNLDADLMERRTEERTDPETGEVTEVEESNSQYLSRTEQVIRAAGPAFGVRVVDPLCVIYDGDPDAGLEWGMVVERKSRKREFRALSKKYGARAVSATGFMEDAPSVGASGFPEYQAAASEGLPRDEVVTVLYWDEYWYCYIVDGHAVDGPRPHKLPGVPLILFEGQVTGSPNRSERLQSVVYNMTDLELGLNDLLTLELDNAIRFGQPKPAVESDQNADPLRDKDGEVMTLDFTGPGVPQLNPGQRIVDGYAGFRPAPQTHMQQMLLQLWQRSGLNPIAQGQSPGADPAGYTVNSLQGAAQSNYEGAMDNFAVGLGRLCDFVRLMVRDTLKEKVYTSLPAEGNKKGSQWLSIGPDDIDESPTVVKVDPMSDANRIQQYQMMAKANEQGHVPRRKVQEAIPGYEDGDIWDNEILVDGAVKDLAAAALQSAKQRIAMEEAAAHPQLPGAPPTTPTAPPEGMGVPPGAPSVGPAMAEASQGGGGGLGPVMEPGIARGGLPSAAAPQQGVMTRGMNGGS